MSDPRGRGAVSIDPDAFAALLCDWCIQVRERDQVLLVGGPLALTLLRALHRALLERKAWPLVRLPTTGFERDFYAHARELHLDGLAPIELNEARQADALIEIDAPEDVHGLSDVDPALVARVMRSRQPLHQAIASLRWCRTLWPTHGLAGRAGMNEGEFASLLARALFLDRSDPPDAWRALSEEQQRLAARLTGAREIRIEAEGTDLRLRVAGRRWVNSDGRQNMPSGEVFTGPIEHSATGTIRFTVPGCPRGVEVANVQLTFDEGRVTQAWAERGQDYLDAALATDTGARFLGEFGIGTNPGIDRPTGSILLDEKMAGTIHLALGRSYPETGGRNVSALHWDLICDLRHGGAITADGEPVALPIPG